MGVGIKEEVEERWTRRRWENWQKTGRKIEEEWENGWEKRLRERDRQGKEKERREREGHEGREKGKKID